MDLVFTMKKYIGFSLIEVLVVIILVGILSSVAIPNYRNYIAKSQVAKGLYVANEFMEAILLQTVKEGITPSSVLFKGETINREVNTEVNNIEPFKFLYWETSASGIGVAVYFRDLSLSAFEEPQSPWNLGKSSRIGLFARLLNNEYRVFCGAYWGDVLDIAAEFRPATCNCNVAASQAVLGVSEFCGNSS